MNQQNAPSDATIDNWQWQSLGTYQVASGNLVVQLSNNANGDVVADAVRVVEVTPPATPASVVDNSDAGYAETGSTWLSWSDPSLYDGNCRYAPAGTGQNTAKWTFNGLDPTKTYQIYATWNPSGNHAGDVPYTVLDGTNTLATVRINQQNLPNDATIGGQAWGSLGTYQATSGNLWCTTLRRRQRLCRGRRHSRGRGDPARDSAERRGQLRRGLQRIGYFLAGLERSVAL